LLRPGRVFDLTDCRIARASLMELWHDTAAHRALLPDRLTGLALREDRDGAHHVVAETGDQRPWDATGLARALTRDRVTLWWRPFRGAARAVAGARSAYPVLAFEQVHPAFGARIRDDAVAALGSVAGRNVWDLYAGTGDAAHALADSGATVTAVEVDRSAVAWGRARAPSKEDGTGIVWRQGRVEDEVGGLPNPEAVVANPPRAGLARPVVDRLDALAAAGRLGRLAYVSCDPATLARDIRRLPHLRLTRVTAYDLFPQTAHVETLALLEAA
jgi:23S rRNA (uracil1939-C5)-methyltransferase